MDDDVPRREIIERDRVSIRSSADRAWRIHRDRLRSGWVTMPGGKEGRRFPAPRPVRVTVAPDLVTPSDDRAGGIEIRGELDEHGRTERRPRELVGARPLHADRAS